jgi:hypothetical protein
MCQIQRLWRPGNIPVPEDNASWELSADRSVLQRIVWAVARPAETSSSPHLSDTVVTVG